MTAQSSADFDLAALYSALDAQRRERGLSWQQVTREVNDLFRETTARPISASTLTGLRGRRVAEGDGVLQMLLWLGRTPESFVPGWEDPDAAEARLPVLGPRQILRFDPQQIYSALEARRMERGMTWTQVAAEIGGLSASSLTHLATGTRVGFPQVMRIARWLGRTAASLTRASSR